MQFLGKLASFSSLFMLLSSLAECRSCRTKSVLADVQGFSLRRHGSFGHYGIRTHVNGSAML